MSDAQKPLPDRLLIFRRVGSDRPHVGEDGETMSWANADGQAYVHGDLHEAVKAENERLRAENERLRAGIQAFLDGCPEIMPRATAYRNDGVPSKHDQCQHGQYMWEGCEACADIFMRWVLDGWPDRATLKGETP